MTAESSAQDNQEVPPRSALQGFAAAVAVITTIKLQSGALERG